MPAMHFRGAKCQAGNAAGASAESMMPARPRRLLCYDAEDEADKGDSDGKDTRSRLARF